MLLPLPLVLVCFLSSHSLDHLFRLHQSINIYFPSLFYFLTPIFLISLSSSSSNFPVHYLNFHLPPSYLVSISVANKMKDGVKDRCDAAFNKTVSGSCGLDQQFSSVIRLEEDSGPHTSTIQDTRTKKSDMQRSTGRVQRYVHEKLTSYILFDPSFSSIFPDEVLSSR